MKLINRKTGQMVVFGEGFIDLKSLGCKNVAEMLEAGWEDYKEPKPQVVYYIDRDGEIVPYKNVEYPKRVFDNEQNKEIGNYFETREEAVAAVEKLKAWKRLKDKGFKFKGWSVVEGISFELPDDFYDANDLLFQDDRDDLDLLFGGLTSHKPSDTMEL